MKYTRMRIYTLQALLLPTRVFGTNKRGYPVLSKAHQDYISFMAGHAVQVRGHAVQVPMEQHFASAD